MSPVTSTELSTRAECWLFAVLAVPSVIVVVYWAIGKLGS